MLKPNTWHPRATMCAESNIYGAGLCVESELKREYYHEEYPLYYFLGYTHMAFNVVPGMHSKSNTLHHTVLCNRRRHPKLTYSLKNVLYLAVQLLYFCIILSTPNIELLVMNSQFKAKPLKWCGLLSM